MEGSWPERQRTPLQLRDLTVNMITNIDSERLPRPRLMSGETGE